MDGWVPVNCDMSGKEMKLYASKRDEKPVVIEKMANFHKFVIESKEVTKMYGMISSCMQVSNVMSTVTDVSTSDVLVRRFCRYQFTCKLHSL